MLIHNQSTNYSYSNSKSTDYLRPARGYISGVQINSNIQADRLSLWTFLLCHWLSHIFPTEWIGWNFFPYIWISQQLDSERMCTDTIYYRMFSMGYTVIWLMIMKCTSVECEKYNAYLIMIDIRGACKI